MTFFDLGVSEKDQSATDFMARLNRRLIAALLADETEHGSGAKARVAEKLGVHRSVVTKMLKGSANLTERSIGEILWALGYRGDLRIEKVQEHNGPASHMVVSSPVAATIMPASQGKFSIAMQTARGIRAPVSQFVSVGLVPGRTLEVEAQ